MVVSKTTTTKRVYRLLLSFRLVADDEVFVEQNGAGVVTSYIIHFPIALYFPLLPPFIPPLHLNGPKNH